jgi:PRTRC genetic system protein E
MNLFKQLQPLAAAGVKFHFKLASTGDALQFDIIPVAKENAVGVSLPAQALTGTAEELDEQFEAFFATYLKTSATINTMIADAEAKLKEAEAEAKRSIAAKVTAKPAAKSPAAAKQGGKVARNPDADLSDMDDEDDEEDSALCANESETAPSPASTQPPKAQVQAKAQEQAQAQALDPDLFV